jgi:membrane fusion protein (multidrug efflux system)
MLLPQTAVLQNDPGRFGDVLGEENQAQVRPIQTDGWQGNQWVVVGGLKEGDKVIADNLLRVRPGSPVRPLDPNAAPGTTPGAAPATGSGAPAAAGAAPAAAAK